MVSQDAPTVRMTKPLGRNRGRIPWPKGARINDMARYVRRPGVALPTPPWALVALRAGGWI